MKDKDFVEGPWSRNNLDNGADLLIPVPPPFCGVLIIGEETIVYCSASAFKVIQIRPVSQAELLQLCLFRCIALCLLKKEKKKKYTKSKSEMMHM